MTRTYVKIASFNVRNLVLPGVKYYGNNSYSNAAYRRKLTWLAEQLIRMDADVVCLQEVFHAEAVDALVARYHALIKERLSSRRQESARYVDHWTVANMDATAARPQPGLAVLSRSPLLDRLKVQDLKKNPIEIEPSMGFSYRLDKLSRPLMAIKVDLGQGVDGWVYNAHLKSKRPLHPENSTAEEEENLDFYGRAQGTFRSLALRAGEALALRRLILEHLTGSDTPVIVAGDLNDEVGAVTTEMVAGEMPFRGWDYDVKRGFWDVEMYSAVRSHMRRTEHASIHTHVYNGHYGTIDHILVSQEFYYRNPLRVGDINYVQVFNDHLTDNSITGAPSLGDASDHGQVVVRLSIESERIEARRSGEFEIYTDDDGKFRFQLKATNGEVIAESQAYTTKAAAEKGIESVRRNAYSARLEDLS